MSINPASPKPRPPSDAAIADRIANALPKAERKKAHEAVTTLMAQMHQDGIDDPRQQADILGQTNLETTLGNAMLEHDTGSGYNGEASLGNTHPGDGPKYKGRGFIQITGRASYTYWGRRLGVDLINHPELAARPDIAAKIAVQGMRDGTFTGMTADGHLIAGGGYKLCDFINDKKTDFFHSRKIVNGLDRASELAQKARTYLENITKPR